MASRAEVSISVSGRNHVVDARCRGSRVLKGTHRIIWGAPDNSPLTAEEIQPAGSGEGADPVSGPEFAVDVVRVGLDRAHGDEEIPRDLGVGPARGEAVQYLYLALAQGLVELLRLARGAFAPFLK